MTEVDPIMTVEEWLALDRGTREKIEADCFQQGVPRRVGRLAEEVAKILAKELVHIPQVTGVCIGQNHIPRRVILMVSTTLSETEKMAGIPEEFCGFAVIQFGMAERRRNYLQRLEFVLRAAAIPPPEADALLEWFAKDLSNIDSPRYCETPARWIAGALVSAVLKGSLVGEPYVSLRGSIQNALTGFFKEADPAQVGLDPSAISRLRTVLEEEFAGLGVKL